jgi:16S rRNA (cytosine967-C5)-methyltransferase
MKYGGHPCSATSETVSCKAQACEKELCRRSRKIENIVRFCKKEALGRHWRTAEKNYSERVAPGGILVYCTCSLSSYENKNVVKKFLETHSSFEPAPLAKNFDLEEIGNGITISPAHLDGDGLYIATFRRS